MDITYKIAIGIIIVALIILLPDATMYYQRYKLRSEKLPDFYKSYTELDSLKDDYYEVLEINSEFVEPVIQADDSTIVIICGQENGDTIENIWYKINPKGEITDTLKYKYKSGAASPASVPNEKEVKYAASTYDIDSSSKPIRRAFVHKEHWIGHSFWNIRKNMRWGTGNGAGTNGWTGTSYFQIEMREKMLPFKQFVAIDKSGYLRDRFFYFVYKPPHGEYLLLNDTQNRRYYLIRPKVSN